LENQDLEAIQHIKNISGQNLLCSSNNLTIAANSQSYHKIADDLYNTIIHNDLTLGHFIDSWNTFELDEFEKIVRTAFESDGGFTPDRYRTPFYHIHVFNSKEAPSIYINFMDATVFTPRNLGHIWLSLGPNLIKNQSQCISYNEIEYSTNEQASTLIVDFIMSSLDERYFWCAKLINWLEANCHNLDIETEDTILQFLELYLIDNCNDFDEENTTLMQGAIELLFLAANETLSGDALSVIDKLTSAHFQSHATPSTQMLKKFGESSDWEIIRNQLNDAHKNKSHSTTSQLDNSIDNLVKCADQMEEEFLSYSLYNVVEFIASSLTDMSAENSRYYSAKLRELENVDNVLCAKHLKKILSRPEIHL